MTNTLIPDPIIQQDLEQAVEILKQGGCAEIFLFGSWAEGRAHAKSDIDLAVRGCPQGRFFRLLGELLFALPRSVDLVDLEAADPFSEYLAQKGVMIRVG